VVVGDGGLVQGEVQSEEQKDRERRRKTRGKREGGVFWLCADEISSIKGSRCYDKGWRRPIGCLT